MSLVRDTEIETYTSRLFDYERMHPETIHIKDIAVSLGGCRRWMCFPKIHYSVAEHSVHMARYLAQESALTLPPIVLLSALMHDAQEAYLGDVATPLKRMLPDYRALETKLATIITLKYGLSRDPGHWKLIKEIDHRILVDEKKALFPHSDIPWEEEIGAEPLGIDIECWDADKASWLFLHSFESLTKEINNEMRSPRD